MLLTLTGLSNDLLAESFFSCRVHAGVCACDECTVYYLTPQVKVSSCQQPAVPGRCGWVPVVVNCDPPDTCELPHSPPIHGAPHRCASDPLQRPEPCRPEENLQSSLAAAHAVLTFSASDTATEALLDMVLLSPAQAAALHSVMLYGSLLRQCVDYLLMRITRAAVPATESSMKVCAPASPLILPTPSFSASQHGSHSHLTLGGAAGSFWFAVSYVDW